MFYVGLFLIMNSCESMTDLQWALLVRQKIMHWANNTQLSLIKKNDNLALSQWRLGTQGFVIQNSMMIDRNNAQKVETNSL